MKLDYEFGVIYKITNLINNKVYIGQTVQPLEQRWRQHCYKKGCIYMHNAILKYGKENFSKEIIEYDVPVNELNNKETFWIKHYKSYIRDFGYNILIEGGHGRRGLSKLSNEQIWNLLDLYFRGVTYTELGKRFNMHRKSVKALIERINGFTLEPQIILLKDKIDLEWLKQYLFECNPMAKEVIEQLHISSATLFKYTKSIGYKFLTYQQRLRLEYNSSKSVQHPQC